MLVVSLMDAELVTDVDALVRTLVVTVELPDVVPVFELVLVCVDDGDVISHPTCREAAC